MEYCYNCGDYVLPLGYSCPNCGTIISSVWDDDDDHDYDDYSSGYGGYYDED